MALTSERIVAGALRILDDYGLQDLTMRRLADEVGVQPGALYWHFPNKQSLLAGLADHILAGMAEPPSETVPQVWLATWAQRFRAVLLGHRDAAELVSSSRAMRLGRVDPCEGGRAVLQVAGLAAGDADATMQAFLHFVLGHVMEQQTRAQLAALGVLDDADVERSRAHFDRGIALLTAGLSATHQA